MSAASDKALARQDEYIEYMKDIGKTVTVLRPYPKDHKAVVSARHSKKYKGDDKDFTSYRGYPVIKPGDE